MKFLVFVILIILNKYSFAAEWISEASAKISILKKIELPGGSVYSSFEVNGASKDNVGKYGTAYCVGHRIDSKNKLEEQKLFCNTYISDGNEYSFMQIRKKTDTDAGVGKTIILNGTGPYKKLANKECIYAVKYLNDHAFLTTKCSVTKNMLNLLKK